MKLKQLPRHLANLAIIIAFLGHVAVLWKIPLVEDLEPLAYDFRLRMMMPGTKDDSVVILDIDERSLKQEGRWPWPRERMAYLVDLLFDYYGVRLLAFDVVFSERDESSGLPVLDMLAQGPLADNEDFLNTYVRMAPELDYDAVFARSLQGRDVILGWFGTDELIDGSPLELGQLPAPILQLEGRQRDLLFMEQSGYGANLPVLQEAANSGGFFHNVVVDQDGKFRRFQLVLRREDSLYASISLAMVNMLLGSPGIELIVSDQYQGEDARFALEGIKVGDFRIPTDHRGAVLVPYLGPQASFPYVPLADVLNAQVDPEVLRDRMVIVGTTAAGLLDMRATPVQNVYPGVEIHANIIAGVLQDRVAHRPAYVQGIEFISLLALGLLFAVLVPALPPGWSILASSLTVMGLVAANFYAWSELGLAIDYAVVLLMVLALVVSDLFFGFFIEMRDKRQLSKIFGQYVPRELVDEMSENPADFSLAGESKELTVLFSDVRGFTTISEGMNATELTKVMNNILTPMTRVIHEHRGTIDKYMGDCIMAFWGAPLADAQHASHAVAAGLDLLAATGRLRAEFRERGWPPIYVGVGCNSGPMSVGNMGSEFRMAYTVMGDAVNLGSRVEGLTKQYGVEFLVTEYTVAAAPEYVYREVDRVRVKGKQEPVQIYEPVCERSQLSSEDALLLEQFHEALQRYREQDWEQALSILTGLAGMEPDRELYAIYLQRVRHFLADPPAADWDGVFVHTTK